MMIKRLVLTLATLALLVAMFTTVLSKWTEPTAFGQPPVEYVVVAPGGTLWQIAKEYYPHLDPREVIHAMREINQLSTANVQVHQKIFLPRGEH